MELTGEDLSSGDPLVRHHALILEEFHLSQAITAAEQVIQQAERGVAARRLGIAAHILKYGGSVDQAVQFLQKVEPVTSGAGSGAEWRMSRERDLKQETEITAPELLITACERLFDLSELVLHLRQAGARVWAGYPVHGAEVFWFYRECLQLFHRRREELPQPELVANLGIWLRELKTYTMQS